MNGMRRDDYYANKLSPFAPLKSTQKTPQKILAAIRANPSVGTQEMADMIGVERSTVARAIAKLKRDGILRRVGPDKGGHWEVVEG
jgi:predicted HTH transcriptional regulator